MSSRLSPADIAIAFICVAVVPLIAAWSGRTLSGTPDRERRLVGRYLWVIGRGVLVGAAIIAVWLRRGRPFAALGLGSPVDLRGRIGFGIDSAILIYYAYAVLRTRTAPELTRVRERLRRMNSDRMLPRTTAELWLYPWMAIVGSAFEELAYRGFLMWLFVPMVGVVGAVLISSAAFSAAHAYLGWIGMLRTALIGLGFALAFVATSSLWWLIVAHATVNLFGLPLQRRLQTVSGVAQPS